jgi:hypothetical protein
MGTMTLKTRLRLSPSNKFLNYIEQWEQADIFLNSLEARFRLMTKYRKLQQPLFLEDGDTGETRVLSNVEWRDGDVKPRQNMVVAELVDEKLEVSGDAEAHTMTGDLHEMIARCAANKTNYNMQVVKLETKQNIFDKMFSPLGPKLQKEDSSTKPPPKKKQKRDAIYCVASSCYQFGDVQVKQSSFEQLRDGSLLCTDTVDLALGESFFCSLTHIPIDLGSLSLHC